MRLSICTIFICLFWMTLPSHAQTTNVRQLFLEIPSELLGFYTTEGKLEPVELRGKRVTLEDIPNGYLELDAKGLDGFDSKIQVALFKMTKGGHLVLMAFHLGDSTDDLRAFRKNGDQWKDVSEIVLPRIETQWLNQRAKERVPEVRAKGLNIDDCASGTFEYVLPRKGRTIQGRTSSDCLTTGNKEVLLELVPVEDKFVLK